MDVTDISTSWESQSTTLHSMRDNLARDIKSLEEIIGDEMTVDDLREVAGMQ